jgi:hypothetical protein
MVISKIRAKLYILKLKATSEEKNWLLFVNVIQKFRKAVQMSSPPCMQAGHGTQIPKSVLSGISKPELFPHFHIGLVHEHWFPGPERGVTQSPRYLLMWGFHPTRYEQHYYLCSVSITSHTFSRTILKESHLKVG